jgi:hypothetical protein
MSRYVRWEFRLWGKGHLVIFIHGQLGFPYLMIDRQREHLGVSSSFEWWAERRAVLLRIPGVRPHFGLQGPDAHGQ